MHNWIAASKLKSSLTRPSFFLHPSYHFLHPKPSTLLIISVHKYTHIIWILRHSHCYNTYWDTELLTTMIKYQPILQLWIHTKWGLESWYTKKKTTSHLETQPKTHSHVPFRTSLGLIEDRESQRGWVGGEKGKIPPWGRRPVEVELQSSRSGHGGSGLVRRESEV